MQVRQARAMRSMLQNQSFRYFFSIQMRGFSGSLRHAFIKRLSNQAPPAFLASQGTIVLLVHATTPAKIGARSAIRANAPRGKPASTMPPPSKSGVNTTTLFHQRVSFLHQI